MSAPTIPPVKQALVYVDNLPPSPNFKAIRGRHFDITGTYDPTATWNPKQLLEWNYDLIALGTNLYGGKAQKTDRSWPVQWWTNAFKSLYLADNPDGYPEYDPAAPLMRALACRHAVEQPDGAWLWYDFGSHFCPFKNLLPADHPYRTDRTWQLVNLGLLQTIRSCVGTSRKLIANITEYPSVDANSFGSQAYNVLDAIFKEMGNWDVEWNSIAYTMGLAKPFLFCYRDAGFRDGKPNLFYLASWLALYDPDKHYLAVCSEDSNQIDITPYLPKIGKPKSKQGVRVGLEVHRSYDTGTLVVDPRSKTWDFQKSDRTLFVVDGLKSGDLSQKR